MTRPTVIEIDFITTNSAATTSAPTCVLTPTPSTITAGQSATLTATCTPAATSYQWSDPACSSLSNICTVTPSVTTNYSVQGVNLGGMGVAVEGTVVVGDVKTKDGLAYLTLGATKSLTTDIFNNWGPEEGGLSDDYPTHLLYSPEDYSTSRATETDSTALPLDKKTIQPLGGRIPIILVHGWQGDYGKTKPQSQMTKKLSADDYWNNLIQFFKNNLALKNKYKLYVYKYPSYKHVTFNASKLKTLLNAMPDLKNAQQMSFIGHSMGTIVIRSLFEEHDFDHSRVQKIIMLDGVHHGSPASVPGLVVWNTNYLAGFGKDLYTLGSNDIQWDNYDNMYNSTSKSKSSGEVIGKLAFNIVFDGSNFMPTKHTASSSNSLESLLIPKADEQPVNFYCFSNLPNSPVQKQCIRRPENSAFDTLYRKRIINLMINNPQISLPSIKNSSDVNSYMYGTVTEPTTSGYGSTFKVGYLPLVPNPWLSYLNLKHQTMPISYQSKMYLYAAVNMPSLEGDDKDKTVDASNINGFSFDMASNGVKKLGRVVLNDFGYWNDGPVPLTGQLMDMSKSFDEWVVSSNNSTTIAPYYNSWLSGKNGTFAKYSPGSIGYEGNGYAKHRLFMDYNHDRMLNGCYTSDPSDLVTDTSDFKNCWKNPADWITYLTYASDKNKGNILSETALPDSPVGRVSFNLLEEPLFLAIQQDLIPPTDPKTQLDCIFNWAERVAPDVAPVSASYKSEIDPLYPDYYYRPYANGNYLIGSIIENQFYIYGKDRPLMAFDRISNMAKMAGCNP